MKRRFFERHRPTRLTIERAREEVSIDQMLVELGGEASMTHGRWDGWTKVRCPLHDDRTASASMNRGAGLFQCFVCHEKPKDVIDLVCEEVLHRRDIPGALDWLRGRFGL